MSIFADRAQSFRSSVGLSDTDVIIGNDTSKWRFMKKQIMVALKQHGDGLKHLEAMTLKHGDEMLQKMEDYKGQPFDPSQLLNVMVASIMLTLIYGESTEQDAMNFIHNDHKLVKVYKPSGAYFLLDILPILRFIIPSVKRAYVEFLTEVNNTNTLYDNMTAARRKTFAKHMEGEYFIDHFLKLEGERNKIVNEIDIRSMGLDMFGAGFTTTSKTLEMMLAILVNHPEVQDKAYKEIVEVIGNRKPRIEDRISMPFTEALILETLRYHSLNMLAFPHKARFFY